MPIKDGLITCRGYVGSLYTLKDGTMKLTLEIDRKNFLPEIHAIDELFQQGVIIHIQDYELFVKNQVAQESEQKLQDEVLPEENISGPDTTIDDPIEEANENNDIDSDLDNELFYEEMAKAGIPYQSKPEQKQDCPKEELQAVCRADATEHVITMNEKRSTAYKHLLYAGVADKRATILMCIYGKPSIKDLDESELDQLIQFLSDGQKVLNYLPIRNKLLQIYETKSTKGIIE